MPKRPFIKSFGELKSLKDQYYCEDILILENKSLKIARLKTSTYPRFKNL